ncbi:MAG: hypothetical protein IT317_07030 [Anaerolineales bacterium]|nr:hypothetical protein [Anaerolineales bacterium]
MSRRLSVLFLTHPTNPNLFRPWGADLVAALGDRHDLRLLDRQAPLAPQFAGVDVVIDHGGSAGTREMLHLATNCRLWQILGTGLDHFDLDYWRAQHMPVANCPGQFSATALGECALLLLLMLTRRWPVAHAGFQVGRLYEPLGQELAGLRLLIVGFGASGRELARRARPFGLRLAAIDIRDVPAAEAQEFGLEFVGEPAALDAQLALADVVSLHLHLTAETRHTLDARRLSLLKPSAYLINVARGALVDEAALTAALAAGRLGGAGLDAFSQEPPDPRAPLFQLPNVIATPHIAGVTDGTSRKRAQCCADNVDRVAAGLEPLYRVA